MPISRLIMADPNKPFPDQQLCFKLKLLSYITSSALIWLHTLHLSSHFFNLEVLHYSVFGRCRNQINVTLQLLRSMPFFVISLSLHFLNAFPLFTALTTQHSCDVFRVLLFQHTLEFSRLLPTLCSAECLTSQWVLLWLQG